MTQVVLSLEDKYDKKLRRLANTIYSGKKGAMSSVVENGLDLVERELEKKNAYIRLLSEAETAKDLKIGKFKREEAYE